MSCWQLARNPRVQRKLREELHAADVADSFEALNELPYLEQCLQGDKDLQNVLTLRFLSLYNIY